jgi:sulfur carrier protein ThiS
VCKNIVTEVAEELQGTCKTLDDVLAEYGLNFEDVAVEFHQDIAEITEVCETCGWWCEPFEVEDNVCQDCREN